MFRISGFLIAALLPVVSHGAEVSPQLASIEIQRAAIERQLSSVQGQLTSVERQRVSVKQQEHLVPVWKDPLPAAPVASIAIPSTDCQPIAAGEAETLINSAADRENLPPELLRAVIKQESSFKPCAISSAGAQGLMQLMPETALDLHVNDPFNPRENIRGGAAYLKQLVTRYGGDLRRALGAYNAGMGRVDALGAVPDFLETQNYVAGITGRLGYDQLPALANGEEAVAAAEESIIDAKDFRPTSLQLSLGNVTFAGTPRKPIVVSLAADKQ